MAKLSDPNQAGVPAHLCKFERIILNGAEWQVATSDWLVLQLSEGIAYALDSKDSKELPLAGVIVCPPKSAVTLTASVLGRALFRGMAVRVESLTGFLTALERRCLETEVARQYAPFIALPADHAMARRMTQIFGQDQAASLNTRLSFAQAFSELVEPQLQEAMKKGLEDERDQQEAKGRLRRFISQIPESELARLSLGGLAKQLHCCERHTSRLFREEWATSFPAYVSDLRLKKACHLLLQGNLKIIDVALESGHGSLAHFNYVFKERFHMTPTEWRERRTAPPRRASRAKPPQMAALAIALLLGMAGMTRSFGAEGGSATNSPAAATSSTNAPARAAITLPVDRYVVNGNTLLSSNVISRVLAPYTGEAVGISAITNGAIPALQMEYVLRGYVTVKVTAPPQTPTNRFIVLQVTEGKLASVKILHNHFFNSNNIMSALPYVQTLTSGQRILNAKVFQTELDRANSNPDRQISPEIRPGLEPGTSALILDVKDRLPLHGRLEFDNYSPPGTPELRLNANISYANLWQLDHTLGFQYGFSPEMMKPSLGSDTHVSLYPMDAPQVTYYSGFYRAPFGPPAAVEDQISQNPNRFGYNETTRQFVQPPDIGRPDFTAYASRSTTGPTAYGPVVTEVAGNPTVLQQFITQTYTSQTTVGGRFSFPLPEWEGIQSSWSFGMDYKDDKVVSLPTNNFYTITYNHLNNNPSSPLVAFESTTSLPDTGHFTFPSLAYTPLFLGWTGTRRDQWGQKAADTNRWSQFDGGVSLVAGTGGTFSKDKSFPFLIANTTEATTEFIAIRPQLSRTQVLPADFTLYGGMSGQWANEPLLNLEQFSLGGNGSVRGYHEGELYADNGWVGQVEVRSPTYWRGATKRLGTQITLFNDYGEGYQLGAPNPYHALWGAGVGINFNLGPYVESHLLIAWPLINSVYSIAGHERLSFSVSAQL